jgi:hypothetical protein
MPGHELHTDYCMLEVETGAGPAGCRCFPMRNLSDRIDPLVSVQIRFTIPLSEQFTLFSGTIASPVDAWFVILCCFASMLAPDRYSLSLRVPILPLLLETDDICSPHILLPYSTANRSPCSDDDIVPLGKHTLSASLSILSISFLCIRQRPFSLLRP